MRDTKELRSVVRQCMNKKWYTTEKFAKKVAQGVLEKRGIALRAYQCPYCLNYHLTKKDAD